jgi:hypothetical protein
MDKSANGAAEDACKGIHDIVAQLGPAIHALLKGLWDEPVRGRAGELADRLVAACAKARLRRATQAARALQSLVKLAREDVRPMKDHLSDKLFELLGMVTVLTDTDSSAGPVSLRSYQPTIPAKDRSRALRASS